MWPDQPTTQSGKEGYLFTSIKSMNDDEYILNRNDGNQVLRQVKKSWNTLKLAQHRAFVDGAGLFYTKPIEPPTRNVEAYVINMYDYQSLNK